MKQVRFAAILFTCVIALVWTSSAIAGRAAFTADGKSVYLTDLDTPGSLDMIDMESGKATKVKVGLGKDDVVGGIALAKDGAFYLVTKHSLWHWTPGEAKAKWMEKPPEKGTFHDVACNFKTDEVLITDENGSNLYYKRDRRSPLIFVGIRYPPGQEITAAPVYLQDGSFLFAADGDLWHGFIELTADGSRTLADLVAYRYAPMCERETYNGTPIQTGILGIAAGKKKVYVDFSRIHGSGWGSIKMLNLPEQKDRKWQSKNSAETTVLTLKSIEETDEDTSGCLTYLCGSADGRLVYYGNRMNPESRRVGYLFRDDSKSTEPLIAEDKKTKPPPAH